MSNYLIIGASSGIGKKTAEFLKKSGHQVYGTYNKTQNTNEDEPSDLFHLDVLANNFSLDFLPDQLDGLIYCPGSINLRPFERIKEEDFLNDYKLQVLGAIKSIQAVISRLKKIRNWFYCFIFNSCCSNWFIISYPSIHFKRRH